MAGVDVSFNSSPTLLVNMYDSYLELWSSPSWTEVMETVLSGQGGGRELGKVVGSPWKWKSLLEKPGEIAVDKGGLCYQLLLSLTRP